MKEFRLSLLIAVLKIVKYKKNALHNWGILLYVCQVLFAFLSFFRQKYYIDFYLIL